LQKSFFRGKFPGLKTTKKVFHYKPNSRKIIYVTRGDFFKENALRQKKTFKIATHKIA